MGRLFWKFLAAFWLALLLAGLGVGSAVWLHQRSLEKVADSLAIGPRDAFMVHTAALTLRHGGSDGLRSLLQEWQHERGASVFALDDAGHELLGRSVSPEAEQQARELAGTDTRQRIARMEMTPDGQRFLIFVPAQGNGAMPARIHHPPRPSPWILIISGLLASLAFSSLLAWYFARPIRHLRWAVKQVEQGRFETRVQPLMGRRKDEISELGADFDHMAQQLENLIGAQRRLLHDVSHELRSPLARLQVAVDLARQQPERLPEFLERIERESRRLDRLVDEVLTLARLEAGVRLDVEDVALGELLDQIVDDARFEARVEARQKNLHFTNDAKGQDVLRGQAELLHRSLENVIRNAMRHTAEGSSVDVVLTSAPGGHGLTITVDDHGPGVPEAQLSRIFEPFSRGDQPADNNGYGLGLAIARRAIEAHGGRIRASNRSEDGLRVSIELPGMGKD